MRVVDHLYASLLVLIPLYGWHSYRRIVERARQGQVPDRRKLYLHTQALQWLLLGGVVLLWVVAERPAAQLGLVTPGGAGFWLSAGIAACATGYLVYAWLAARRLSPDMRDRQYARLGDLQYFLPTSAGDFRHFAALSVVAGIVEEIVYRGFLFWYLAWLMPIWAVVVVSSAIFAFGHAYQGPAGMLRVFVVGLAFPLLYLLSGSLWIPMLLHVLVDVLQGAVLLELSRKPPAEDLVRIAP